MCFVHGFCVIGAEHIARYQGEQLKEGASPKTVNLEVGTLRAVLRKQRLWATIQPDVRMLRARDDVGRAISCEEEAKLLEACQASRSRSLYTAVVLVLNTCMRYSELRLLNWGKVDFAGRTRGESERPTHRLDLAGREPGTVPRQ